MAKLTETFPLNTTVRNIDSGIAGVVTGYEGRRVLVRYGFGETFDERPSRLQIERAK